MRIRLFFMVICAIIFYGWTTQQANDIKKAEWLIGTWENRTLRGNIHETWTKTSDDEFSGKSYILKDKDTIVFETIRLVQEQSGLFYIPTVKNQNDALPVRFAMQIISDTTLVFENTQHDFPQIISYTKISADSLVAEISGTKNGQKRKQAFPMIRTK